MLLMRMRKIADALNQFNICIRLLLHIDVAQEIAFLERVHYFRDVNNNPRRHRF